MAWIPKILSLICLWGVVATVILFVEPELLRDILIPNSYLPLFLLLTLTIWYTSAIFIKNAWKSLLFTINIVTYFVLSTLRLMYGALAIALLLTLGIQSWYIYNRHEKNNSTNQ